MLKVGLFQPEKSAIAPTLKWERLALGVMATGAIVGTFAPVLCPSILPKPSKTFLLGYGLFSSVSATLTAALLQRKEKLNERLDKAQEVALNQTLAHQLAFAQSMQTIAAKRELAAQIDRLPSWERARWEREFGLGGLFAPPPQIRVEAVPDAPLAIASGGVATPKAALVDAFVNPTDEAQIKELSDAYPNYIRIDSRWVSDLADSCCHPNMSQRANHHLYLCGETQSGKSTLAGVLVSEIAARSSGNAVVACHDPKKEPGGNDITRWLCDFTYKVDGIAATDSWLKLASKLAKDQTELASGGDCGSLPELILLQDEVDTIYGNGKGFGDRVTKDTAESIKNFWVYGVKYLAGLRGHMVFMGQSPLSGDTGFNRPTLKSICFLAMGQTSSYILNNPKDFLSNASDEALEVLKEACETFERLGKRYVLVRPTRGNPYVALIPDFDVNRQSPIEQDNPVSAIEEWVAANGIPSDEALNRKWQELTGMVLNEEGIAMLQTHLKP